MRIRSVLSSLTLSLVLAGAAVENANALTIVQSQSIGNGLTVSYSGGLEIEGAVFYASGAYQLTESSVVSADSATDSATDLARVRVESPFTPYQVVSEDSAEVAQRRSDVTAYAGDPTEGVNVSESAADGTASMSFQLTFLTPGVLEITMPYFLQIMGGRLDNFETWEASAGAVLSASQQLSGDPIFLEDGDSISYNQDDVVGDATLLQELVGEVSLNLDTTDLFAASGGLPITFLIEVTNGAYASAADARNMQAVPEPTSLALLGIAIVAGRKRLQRVR